MTTIAAIMNRNDRIGSREVVNRLIQGYLLSSSETLAFSSTAYFVFLRKWFTKEYSLIAILFLAMLLPATYAFHSFHPWDRLGVLTWLLFAWAAREDKVWLCVVILAVAVLNKYDAVVLPGLYFLAHVSKQTWKTVIVKTGLMFILGLGIYISLKFAFPGGDVSRDIFATMTRNIHTMLEMNISYPPILAFTIPVIFSLFAWRSIDQFQRASFLFALLVLIGPLFLLTNFEELRAEFALLMFMGPATLTGLHNTLASNVSNSR